jgi:hypothetical protein
MWATAVLASALVRPVAVLTAVVPGGYCGGDGDGGGEGGEGGEGGSGGRDGGEGAGQVETVPETPVRDVAQEQTVPPPPT